MRKSGEGFIEGNPGGWMFHSHILEYQAGGMSGVIHVAWRVA